MGFEKINNLEQSESQRPETVPYLENYAIAAQDQAHIKPELERIFKDPEYDTKRHFEDCSKCQKKAGEMIRRDTRKFKKPRTDPAWMLKKEE